MPRSCSSPDNKKGRVRHCCEGLLLHTPAYAQQCTHLMCLLKDARGLYRLHFPVNGACRGSNEVHLEFLDGLCATGSQRGCGGRGRCPSGMRHVSSPAGCLTQKLHVLQTGLHKHDFLLLRACQVQYQRKDLGGHPIDMMEFVMKMMLLELS